MFAWLSLLLSASSSPACVPPLHRWNRQEVASSALFDRFLDGLETIDIESRDSLARTIAAPLALDRQTNFHKMWNGATPGSSETPALRIDYREAIPGTGAKSMLILEIMSPAFASRSVRTRYSQLRLVEAPNHGCPSESWSYEVPGRDFQLILSFDYSNSFLQSIAILTR